MESIKLFFSSCISNPLVYLLLSVIVGVAIYRNGTRQYAMKRKIGLPGPKPLPFIGNVLDIVMAGGIVNFQIKCLKKYGKNFVYWAPHVSIVALEPELLKEVTIKQFHNFRDRFVRILFSESTKGALSLFRAQGEDWKRIRKFLTPTFSAAKMKLMVPLMEKAVDTLIGKLQAVADTEKVVDIGKWFRQMYLDIILMTAFGIESDVQSNPNHELLEKTIKSMKSHSPFELFLLMIPFGRELYLWIIRVKMYFFPDKPANDFTELAETAVKTRQEHLKKGNAGRKDMLQLLLTEQESVGVGKLSDQDIIAHVKSFLFNGLNVPSEVLSIIIFHLSKNARMQEKLREEITITLQKNKNLGFYELINTMEYLDCVVKEALRFLPVRISLVNRKCSRSCSINGVYFPAGAEVVLPVLLQGKDPDLWPDVSKFEPERHRGPANYLPLQFVPFGSGPRNCIGSRFALLELKLTIVKMLSKLKFVSSSERPKEASSYCDMNLLVYTV